MNTTSALILFTASIVAVALLTYAVLPSLSQQTSGATTTADISYKRVSNLFQIVSAYTDGTYTYFLVSGYSGQVPIKALTAVVDGAPYDVNVYFYKDADGDGLLDPSDVAYIVIRGVFTGEHRVSFVSQSVSIPADVVDVERRYWKYRRVITVSNATTVALTDFQVRVELNTSNFDFTHIQPDCSDIRFTDLNGNLLPYWIETCDVTGKLVVAWVKVPAIPASGDANIYLYYGVSGVISSSNGKATFIFFDDFDTTSGWNCTSVDPTECTHFRTAIVDGRTVAILTSVAQEIRLTSKESVSGLDGVAQEAMVKIFGNAADLDFYIGVDDDTATPPNWGTRVGDNASGQYHAVVVDESVGTQGTTYGQLTWLVVQTIRQGTTVSSYYNGEFLTDTATGTPIDTGYMFMSIDPDAGTALSRGAYVDWLRVRKYVYPEPTATVGPEETGNYTLG